jgi:hypothetical protein
MEQEFLKLQEELLAAQLKIVRGHLRESGGKGRSSPVGVRKSQMSIVRDLLDNGPLHVAEIISRARERYGVDLDRESLVSALTKKVKKGVAFVRTAPNTFGLIG